MQSSMRKKVTTAADTTHLRYCTDLIKMGYKANPGIWPIMFWVYADPTDPSWTFQIIEIMSHLFLACWQCRPAFEAHFQELAMGFAHNGMSQGTAGKHALILPACLLGQHPMEMGTSQASWICASCPHPDHRLWPSRGFQRFGCRQGWMQDCYRCHPLPRPAGRT